MNPDDGSGAKLNASSSTEHRRPAAFLKLSLLGLVLLWALLIVGGLYVGAYHNFSARAMEETIQSWGAWGIAASIGLMVLHSFVPFPAEFLAMANGMVYGLVWGIVITWIGAMLGAFVAFGLARALGRPFVEILVAKKNWHVLDDWATVHGAQIVFLSRLIPVIAFNLINYAVGMSRISWWTFAWATGIGILPMVMLMVLIGDYVEVMTWETWLLVAVFGVVLGFALRRQFHRFRQRESTYRVDPPEP